MAAAVLIVALGGMSTARSAQRKLPIQTPVANYTRSRLITENARTMPRSRFAVRCSRTTYTYRCVAVRTSDQLILNGVGIWRKTRCVYVVTFLSAHLEPVWTKLRSMC